MTDAWRTAFKTDTRPARSSGWGAVVGTGRGPHRAYDTWLSKYHNGLSLRVVA